ADATCAERSLDETGTVTWWSEERRHPTLRTVLLHLIVETARHAGHMDVVRELIDGRAGRHDGDPSMPGTDDIDWPAYRARVDAEAVTAEQTWPDPRTG
ncbi:MAG: DUF664 domain-containing protein, partial [Actinomycetota bacterium]